MSEQTYSKCGHVQLIYQDKKGAGIIKSLPYDDGVVEKALRSVRAEARLMLDGEQIGGVERCTDRSHSKRDHWCWWFETAEPIRERSER